MRWVEFNDHVWPEGLRPVRRDDGSEFTGSAQDLAAMLAAREGTQVRSCDEHRVYVVTDGWERTFRPEGDQLMVTVAVTLTYRPADYRLAYGENDGRAPTVMAELVKMHLVEAWRVRDWGAVVDVSLMPPPTQQSESDRLTVIAEGIARAAKASDMPVGSRVSLAVEMNDLPPVGTFGTVIEARDGWAVSVQWDTGGKNSVSCRYLKLVAGGLQAQLINLARTHPRVEVRPLDSEEWLPGVLDSYEPIPQTPAVRFRVTTDAGSVVAAPYDRVRLTKPKKVR